MLLLMQAKKRPVKRKMKEKEKEKEKGKIEKGNRLEGTHGNMDGRIRVQNDR